MSDVIKINSHQVALKSAIVAIQVEEQRDDGGGLGLFLPAAKFPEMDEVKVLLIGGNSMKFTVKKGEGLAIKELIMKELGWNV